MSKAIKATSNDRKFRGKIRRKHIKKNFGKKKKVLKSKAAFDKKKIKDKKKKKNVQRKEQRNETTELNDNLMEIDATDEPNKNISKRQKKKLKKLAAETTDTTDLQKEQDSKSEKQKKTKKENSKITNKDIKLDRLESLNKKKKRKKKAKNAAANNPPESDSKMESSDNKTFGKIDLKRLEKLLAEKKKDTKAKWQNTESLRDRMMSKLRASRFRFLNETLYNNESSESKKFFKEDPDAFLAYHDGYKRQVEQWPLNPLDVIISSINKMPKDYVVADFGCGEAKLAASVQQKVHSLDLVAVNDTVTACDMAHTPLLMKGANVVVFCLSLMGTNLNDYIIEANRVLKKDGILKIAEVESRFYSVDNFIGLLEKYGFVNTWKDLSHELFYFLDFKKERDVDSTMKLPKIALKTCLYKKR